MTEKTQPPSNAFISVLQQHANGLACQESAEAMQKCIEAVSLTGKPATLTLTVKVSPAGHGGAFVVDPVVATKLPKLKKPTSLWFADEGFNLTRENPAQRQFDLSEVKRVETPPLEPKRAAEGESVPMDVRRVAAS